ncbi:MAG: hypothetical protein IKS14_09510 [Thermoguttaceae bacterium]|nr:hypothetical protein [Thermoguttaceae bacterium]
MKLAFCALAFVPTLALCVGCKSLNEDPKNDRIWFPTLCPPSESEKAARARTFPEGGDPYLDAQVGPKSFDTRPRGWDISRSRTASSFGELPDSPDD